MDTGRKASGRAIDEATATTPFGPWMLPMHVCKKQQQTQNRRARLGYQPPTQQEGNKERKRQDWRTMQKKMVENREEDESSGQSKRTEHENRGM